ncbi:cupin domain-containing protein [Bremerella cremea]|uniref:Cupin domain-containing protein n=1 Tax=Bremerella cremea TaxID=1031537 RepID=A0A368KW40_9BACT|nr:cupin domain-containing protein [Bremerella cremea]RCS54579.1 cupin domain-containing protein [Bremerella cremea]
MNLLVRRLFWISFAVCGTVSLVWGHDVGEGDLKVTVLAKSSDAWDDKPLPHYPTGQPEITVLKIIIPEGKKTPLHFHSVINAAVLLKGEVDVHMPAGETKKLKAGESLIEVVDKAHWGENVGQGDAEFLVFYAGEKGEKITHVLHGDETPEAVLQEANR